MSVVAQSPFTGKRLFDEDQDCQQDRPGAKRSRFGSPGGRCRPAAHSSPQQQQQGIHPNTVRALKALFAEMDEQAVESVLAECGHDVDAAIRRLTELKLSSKEQSETPGHDTIRAASDTQQHTQAGAGDGLQAPAAAGPQTAEQWVDSLVQEMAAAADFADARARAGKLLQAFEHFIISGKEQQQPVLPQSKIEEALRENAILKRAVQIQNTKLQEAATKDQELAALKQLLGQYQERLRHLELNNYSLALHLQKATNNMSQTANGPPDVY